MPILSPKTWGEIWGPVAEAFKPVVSTAVNAFKGVGEFWTTGAGGRATHPNFTGVARTAQNDAASTGSPLRAARGTETLHSKRLSRAVAYDNELTRREGQIGGISDEDRAVIGAHRVAHGRTVTAEHEQWIDTVETRHGIEATATENARQQVMGRRPSATGSMAGRVGMRTPSGLTSTGYGVADRTAGIFTETKDALSSPWWMSHNPLLNNEGGTGGQKFWRWASGSQYMRKVNNEKLWGAAGRMASGETAGIRIDEVTDFVGAGEVWAKRAPWLIGGGVVAAGFAGNAMRRHYNDLAYTGGPGIVGMPPQNPDPQMALDAHGGRTAY